MSRHSNRVLWVLHWRTLNAVAFAQLLSLGFATIGVGPTVAAVAGQLLAELTASRSPAPA